MLKFNQTLKSLFAVLSIVMALFIISVLTFPGQVSANPNAPDRVFTNLPQAAPAPPDSFNQRINPASGPPSDNDDREVVMFRPSLSVKRDAPEIVGFGDCPTTFFENFDNGWPEDPLCWHREDLYTDQYSRTWGVTDHDNHTEDGTNSVWPAVYGSDAISASQGYTDNLHSRMYIGPLDFTTATDVLALFSMRYEMEPDDEIRVCVSIGGAIYECQYWTGDSGGWDDYGFWLTSYAGYQNVYLGWEFISNDSDSGLAGPFIDDIEVWVDDGQEPTPPDPDITGTLIYNGGFETGVTPWIYEEDISIQSVKLNDTQPLTGVYAAQLTGTAADFLYQNITVPTDVVDIDVNYWMTIATNEVEPGYDWFCASFTEPGTGSGLMTDPDKLLVDLGCFDAYYAEDYEGYWFEATISLTPDEVVLLESKDSVDLVFEMYNQDSGGSSGRVQALASNQSVVLIDEVQVYATGGDGGGHIDPNEPNDIPNDATSIICGQNISGAIGDYYGGDDIDWFKLKDVPTGQIDIDIKARTKTPPSELDSFVTLYSSGDLSTPVEFNDDDGQSRDSYVVYTNTAVADYYISVESFTGQGGPDYFYDLDIQCSGAGGGQPPPSTLPDPPDDTWTVMLYLNAEDPGFEDTLVKYINDIEAFIDSKKSFLTVAVLYDGPKNGKNPKFDNPPDLTASGTTRLIVQPADDSYTLDTNIWNMDELNMGHPQTLAGFVNWAMDRYPAENYYLAIDDHGDGAYGISLDKTSNDMLTPEEIHSALKFATVKGLRPID
ncbi:MAG: hypothetical protein GY869_29575, partial [Planctomycetes bacterium]|nr:hypothetical protein [Planctomycetota bacterium]